MVNRGQKGKGAQRSEATVPKMAATADLSDTAAKGPARGKTEHPPRPERCPACGQPTVELLDYRADKGGKPLPGWGCNTPGCAAPGAIARVPLAAGVSGGLARVDLLELGAVAEESEHGAFYDVVTKGGVHLRFPGDEAAAQELTDEQLFGAAAAKANARAIEKADEAALRGHLSPTQRAMAQWGLEKRHVLGSQEHRMGDGTVEVVIVTQGGQRLRWPRDAARVLSPMEKGDAVPEPVPGGIFPPE